MAEDDTSILESYTSLLLHFDKLCGSCADQLNAYSLNPTAETGIIVEQCLLSRQSRTQKVTSACRNLYDSYESCMQTDPNQCVQPLAALYMCARETLSEKE